MTEPELSEEQSARLAAVFQRAAARVEVADRSADRVLARIEERPQRHGGRRLVAAVVAAIMVGGCGFWLLSQHGVEHVETGPAAGNTIDPLITDQVGIWRLPTDLAGYRVVDASTSATMVPVRFAVDDIEAPTRWISFANYGVDIPLDDQARTVNLAAGVSLVLRPTEAANGMEGATQYGLVSGSSSPYVTGAFHGVDERSVVDMFRRAFVDQSTLTQPAAADSTLAGIEPPDGLHPTWDAGDNLTSGLQSLQLTLEDPGGGEVVVGLQSTGLPPAVVELRLRLAAVEMSNRSQSDPDALHQEVRRRPDLGRNVLEERTVGANRQTRRPDATSLMVIADDGTIITAHRAVISSAEATAVSPGATAVPLSRDRQVAIINSLRAMNEADLRTELAASGVELVDPTAQELIPGSVTTTTLEAGSAPVTSRP